MNRILDSVVASPKALRSPRAWAALAAAGMALGACAPAPLAPEAPSREKAAEPGPRAIELRNPGFEAPSRPGERCAVGWSCTMRKDPTSYRFAVVEGAETEGRRSLCIEQVKSQEYGVASQGFLDPPMRGHRVRLSVLVRAEGLGGQGAGPWVQVRGTAGRSSAIRHNLVKRTAGWQALSLEVAIPRDATSVAVGAALYGPGRACFDDVRVEVLP